MQENKKGERKKNEGMHSNKRKKEEMDEIFFIILLIVLIIILKITNIIGIKNEKSMPGYLIVNYCGEKPTSTLDLKNMEVDLYDRDELIILVKIIYNEKD